MIPFCDLNSVNASCRKDIDQAISQTIDSNCFVSTTHKFQDHFALYTGAEFCVGTSSGTAAIHLALLALGVGPGDEVITVSHTFRGTVAPIYYCGATPVYVDIDADTFVMDWTQIESKITANTKAIIPVHLYGNVAPMKEIMKIARRHDLYVIEDCSQAHGSTLDGIHVGNFGDIGTFSFYPSKGLGAFGDAGCVITNNKSLSQEICALSSWHPEKTGYNHRLSVIQAAVLSVKLRYFDEVLWSKRQIANKYNTQFGDVCTQQGVEHSYHIYPILRENRNDLIDKLKNHVELRVHYSTPVHRLQAYRTGDCLPVTDSIAAKQISVPIYPGVDYRRVMNLL